MSKQALRPLDGAHFDILFGAGVKLRDLFQIKGSAPGPQLLFKKDLAPSFAQTSFKLWISLL